MLRELSSSQLLEYKKLLKTVLDGLDSASKIRAGLLEYDSVSKYEYAKYDSLNDPEPYYHIKLFDKAVGIVRLYTSREWFSDDPEKKYFHFAIRLYNFSPYETFNLQVKNCREYSTYGDFQDLEDCLPYFYKFVKQLFYSCKVIKQPELLYLEIY